jgi:hypothetical protein
MGFEVKIEGNGSVTIPKENILTVEFTTDIPKDSNARSTDLGSTLIITGKILAALDGAAADQTIELGKWSVVPAEAADSYRKLEVSVTAANQVVRKITFPNAFVVDLSEDYADETGVGTFRLVVRQKKDLQRNIKIEGGFDI